MVPLISIVNQILPLFGGLAGFFGLAAADAGTSSSANHTEAAARMKERSAPSTLGRG